MNKYIAAVAASVLLFGIQGSAFAGAQQEKMKTCNAEAKEKALKGDERKAFMSKCLSSKSGDGNAKTKTAQQGKMKACNVEAKEKGLAGDERKAFMKGCLAADNG